MYTVTDKRYIRQGRSREGAWIEICRSVSRQEKRQGRSREGAWIEIPLAQAQKMSGLGRSREGAWIEIHVCFCKYRLCSVAPVRERGLK